MTDKLPYRIELSECLGWTVVQGIRVVYFSPDRDDCLRWIRERKARQEARL